MILTQRDPYAEYVESYQRSRVYEDVALDDGDIRVFYIDKGTSPEVTARLATIKLEHPSSIRGWLSSFWTQYEALSYHWGDPARTRTITCNGRPFKIHSNLYDALLTLKQIRPEIPIWADAISINQQDKAEKSAQIRLMGKIFGSARTVWSFIGQPPDGMTELMVHLPEICRACLVMMKSEKRARSSQNDH